MVSHKCYKGFSRWLLVALASVQKHAGSTKCSRMRLSEERCEDPDSLELDAVIKVLTSRTSRLGVVMSKCGVEEHKISTREKSDATV